MKRNGRGKKYAVLARWVYDGRKAGKSEGMEMLQHRSFFSFLPCPKQSGSWTFSSYEFEFQAESSPSARYGGIATEGVNDSNDPGTNFWCEFGLTAVPGLLRPGVRKIQRRQNNRTDAKTASDAEFALIVPAVLFAAASC